MKTTSLIVMKAVAALLAVALLGFIFIGTRATADEKNSATTSTTTATTAEPNVKQTKGGSQLWSENCARCHNMRSPSAYSDAEWDAVMHHMRIRAQLTAAEHKAILEFLKSAN